MLFQNELQTRLVDLLIQLSSSKHLQSQTVTTLCRCIHSYSEELRKVHRREATLDPLKHYSVFYIIQACEKCLTVNKGRDLERSVRETTSSMLEDSLLHLVPSYPLFAHGIWKIVQQLWCNILHEEIIVVFLLIYK